jgi:hypothetical protein
MLQQGMSFQAIQSHKPAADDLKNFNGKKRGVAGGACKHIRAATSHHVVLINSTTEPPDDRPKNESSSPSTQCKK